LRKVRNVGIGDNDGFDDGIGHRAKPRPEHDAEAGSEGAQPGAQIHRRFRNMVEVFRTHQGYFTTQA
jgi:hypothetical protein